MTSTVSSSTASHRIVPGSWPWNSTRPDCLRCLCNFVQQELGIRSHRLSLPRFALRTVRVKQLPQQTSEIGQIFNEDLNPPQRRLESKVCQSRGRSTRSSHFSSILRLCTVYICIPLYAAYYTAFLQFSRCFHGDTLSGNGSGSQVAAHLNLASCHLESEAYPWIDMNRLHHDLQILSSSSLASMIHIFHVCGDLALCRLQKRLWSMLLLQHWPLVEGCQRFCPAVQLCCMLYVSPSYPQSDSMISTCFVFSRRSWVAKYWPGDVQFLWWLVSLLTIEHWSARPSNCKKHARTADSIGEVPAGWHLLSTHVRAFLNRLSLHIIAPWIGTATFADALLLQNPLRMTLQCWQFPSTRPAMIYATFRN